MVLVFGAWRKRRNLGGRGFAVQVAFPRIADVRGYGWL